MLVICCTLLAAAPEFLESQTLSFQSPTPEPMDRSPFPEPPPPPDGIKASGHPIGTPLGDVRDCPIAGGWRLLGLRIFGVQDFRVLGFQCVGCKKKGRVSGFGRPWFIGGYGFSQTGAAVRGLVGTLV